MTTGADAAALFERYRTPPPPETSVGDRALAEAAERGVLRVEPDGVPVSTYLWNPEAGSSRPPVLLVHGWGSRATHLGGMIRALTGAGRRCLAFKSEEHTSELQSLMRISYARFCLKK